MKVWSAEIKELEKYYKTLKGKVPSLEKELERLIKVEDEIGVLVSSRRSLEVIVTDLCETELKRPQGTEPLKGIIDKLNKEGKVPSHIITSMINLNSLSTYGAHAKEFEPEQVKPVLNNLTTIIKWYLKYKNIEPESTEKEKKEQQEIIKPDDLTKHIPKPKKKSVLIGSSVLVISIVLILVFDLFNIIQKDEFEDIRDTDGKITIAVMPFQNMTGDTLYNHWQMGFQNLLISNLSNSEELSVRQPQTMFDVLTSTGNTNYASITPSIASDIALKLESSTLINGSLSKAGENIRISIQLMEAESLEIYKSFAIECKKEDDFFYMADSLSNLLKDFLRIEIMKQELRPDQIQFINTTSPEAFIYFIQASNMFYSSNYRSSIEYALKAVEIDTNFTNCYVMISFAYLITGNRDKAEDAYFRANENRDIISFRDQLFLDHLKYGYLDKNPKKGIQYLYQLAEMEPQNLLVLNNIGDLNRLMHNYDKEIEAYEKYIEIHERWESSEEWFFPYFELGDAYHIKGNHKREEEIYKKVLAMSPEHPAIILRQARCALSLGDTTETNEYLAKYKSIRENVSFWSESRILSSLGNIYQQENLFNNAGKYYREALDLDLQNPERINDLAWYLIINDINVNEGVELINRALEIEPNNFYFLDTKGWGLYKQHHPEEALEFLNKSWDLSVYYNHDSYLLINEVEQAIEKEKR